MKAKKVKAMKDLPVFTTEYGVASLTLREIAYQGKAYIKLQATQQPRELLEACVGFCLAVGAEEIFASGHVFLENYPLHTAIMQMQCAKDMIGETDAALWPLQPEKVDAFLEIYREKVRRVPNGAWFTDADGEKLARVGGGYFVHRDGKLLGIGIVGGNALRFVASVSPGAGADVVCALAGAVTEDMLTLEVATANRKAVSLYEKLGFIPVREISCWYRVG